MDCETILANVKELDQLSHALKQAKAKAKKLKADLSKAVGLFKTALNVKHEYEQVIEKLVNDPLTASQTYSIIESTKIGRSPAKKIMGSLDSSPLAGKSPKSPGILKFGDKVKLSRQRGISKEDMALATPTKKLTMTPNIRQEMQVIASMRQASPIYR